MGLSSVKLGDVEIALLLSPRGVRIELGSRNVRAGFEDGPA